MKLSEVKKELLSKAKERFKILGFKKQGNFIIKNVDDYQFYIGFGIVDNDNSFPTTFHYGIASKTLNNIKLCVFPDRGLKKNDFSGAYSQKQTLLFDKKEYPILEYNIKSIVDIDAMVYDLWNYFEKTAIKKLENLQSVGSLGLLLNSKEMLDEAMHMPTASINALILCKLTDNSKYGSIKQRFINISKDWSNWDKQELEKVVEFLDNHSQEELLKIAENPA